MSDAGSSRMPSVGIGDGGTARSPATSGTSGGAGRRSAAAGGRNTAPVPGHPGPAGGLPHRSGRQRRSLPGALGPRQGRPLHPRRELHRLVLVEGLRQGRPDHLGDPGDRLPLDGPRPARVRAARLSARRVLLLVHVLAHARAPSRMCVGCSWSCTARPAPGSAIPWRRGPRSPATPTSGGATSRRAARAVWCASAGTRPWRSRPPRMCTPSPSTAPTGWPGSPQGHARLPQPADVRVEVGDLQRDPVPAAGPGQRAVGQHRAASGSAPGPAQREPQLVPDDHGERGRRMHEFTEAQLPAVEGDGGVDVVDDVANRDHGVPRRDGDDMRLGPLPAA
ncbi:hypothetical protein C7821_105247 [Streptomyces sp. VMFN-G11Ma]|nr:hypothetical protein C7821_105247 [Streptomyces sp. VMFN-G11Ma]